MSVLTLGRGPALVMAPARAMAEVDAAAAAGADLVEVPGDARLVAAVRAAYPELVIAVRAGAEGAALDCCAAGADLLTGGTFGEVAARFEVGFAGSAALVARAVRAGVGPSRVLVEGSGAAAGSAGSAGQWPVLVSLRSAARPDSDLARAAVLGWLGARVFRVPGVERVRETRRALRMVAAIRGDAPPANAVRGLA